MARITREMLRVRLVQLLATPSPLNHSDSQADYSSLALLSIPTDDAFVTEAYRRVLLREPDLEGMQHFLGVLKACRQMVIDSLVKSQGGSEAAERMPRIAQADGGVTETRPHFIDLTDLDRFEAEEVFVRESYRRILGREADTRGLGYWWTLLLFGVPKVQVLAALVRSNEAQARNLDLDFLWKGQNIQTAGEQANEPDTPCRLTSSSKSSVDKGVPEETLRMVDLTDLDQFDTEEAFVRESYRRILGREADPEGLAHFTTVVASGVSKVQVLALLAESTEAQARNMGFLWQGQRIQAAAERSTESATYADGPVPEQRPGAIDLSGLDQFETEDAFVRESHRRIVGREGDAEGIRHYRELLICGAPKIQVLAQLATSPEAKARSICFLWRGTELPAPVRLGIGTRLRLLYRRTTGQSRFEEALSSLGSQLQTVLERDNALREDINLFSTRTLAAQAQLAAKCDGVVSDIEKLSNRVLKTTAAMLAGHARVENKCENIESETVKQQGRNTGKLSEIASKIENLSNQVLRTKAAAQAAHVSIETKCDAIRSDVKKEGSLWTSKLGEVAGAVERVVKLSMNLGLGGIGEKFDTFSADIRIREEAIQRLQKLGHAEIIQEIAGLHKRAEGIARSIRPPVLAAADVLVTKVDDLVLAVPREDWPLAAYYSFWGSVDQGMTRCFASLLRPDMVVVDIGANIGIHSLYAARAVGEGGRIYSFEPTPRTFAVLRKNLELNGARCVEAFPWAVLDHAGEVALYLREGASGLNSLFPEGGTGKSISVNAVTLDDALPSHERVDVVKIDAEGAEPFILRGMKKIFARNPSLIVLLEFAPALLTRAGIAPPAFLETLRNMGFEIQQVDDFTGALSPLTNEQLLASESSNLHLQRSSSRSIE